MNKSLIYFLMLYMSMLNDFYILSITAFSLVVLIDFALAFSQLYSRITSIFIFHSHLLHELNLNYRRSEDHRQLTSELANFCMAFTLSGCLDT